LELQSFGDENLVYAIAQKYYPQKEFGKKKRIGTSYNACIKPRIKTTQL